MALVKYYAKKEINKIKATLKDYERDAINYNLYLPDSPNEKMVDLEDELLGNDLGGINGTTT